MRSSVKSEARRSPAEAGETADTAAEQAAEKTLPGGGHADSTTDANADHQFEGVE